MPQTFILLVLTLFFSDVSFAETPEGQEPKSTKIKLAQENTVFVIDLISLADTTVKIIAPSGELVYSTSNSKLSLKSEEVEITETGCYWVFYECNKTRVHQRVYIKNANY